MLTDDERRTLERWVRAPSTEGRYAERVQFVLAAARSDDITSIARRFGVRAATVSNWRTSFAAQREAGLEHVPRSGQRVRYGTATETRILEGLDISGRTSLSVTRVRG